MTADERPAEPTAVGHPDVVDLDLNRAYGLCRQMPLGVRDMVGLRSLRIGGTWLDVLPSWLTELPLLQSIDLRGCTPKSMPAMPWVRWALDSGTLWAFRHLIDPIRVYGMTIEPSDDPAAIAHLATLAKQGRLSISELVLKVGVRRYPVRGDWPNLAEIDRHLEEIIEFSPGLRTLHLINCPLRRVPETIRRLPELTDLRLAALLPDRLPDWLFDLPALRTLDLSGNGLTELAIPARPGARLTELDLSGNALREVPDGVWHLTDLVSLNLRNCPIQRIQPGILRLASLTDLRVDETRPELTAPPPEVVARGLDAIKSYWTQEQASGTDYLTEAKLVIVGEPGAGKTTLAKKVLEPGYQLDPHEGSTHGIAVFSWRFRSAIRIALAAGDQLLERDFRVNIWDFGGQEIYHATHQFFLTKRSVYVLLSDGRKEDTDFRYWLEVVNLLSDGSPLLIVQNRKEGRGKILDLRALRQDYPNLIGALSVDLADNSGLVDLIVRVRRELELLPHIGTALPTRWRDVRIALERHPADHIPAEEFFRICTEHGFTAEADMQQLGGFLHDLGICLYFQDDPLLRRMVILKPEWGTGAVYRALEDPEIAANMGLFGPDDLRRIWHEPRYSSMHAELVRLMVKFALCYPVADSDRYVAPQLLSSSRPSYSWDEPGDLALRYEYDIMPKGIVRRLIVDLHDLLEEDTVWRSGAVFRYGRGRAEVTQDYRRRRLHLRLARRDARVILSMIDHALQRIHRSYPELIFERLRPCDCAVCADASDPTMYSMRELEDFAQAGELIQCRASRRLVDAARLLNELWQSGDPGTAPVRLPAAPTEVFVSYKWGGAGDALVDEMEIALAGRGMIVLRDRNELRYRDHIQQFMRRLGAGNFVIVVLDDAYLRSKYCMFELTELAGREDFAKAIFPIVMSDANIFDPLGRVAYIRHWESMRADLDREMRTVGQENLQGIREELDLYDRIRNTVARVTEVLADMNTLTSDIHAGSDFAELFQALDAARGGR